MANIFTDIEFTLVHRLVVPKVFRNIQLALRSIPFVIPHAKYSPRGSYTRRHTDTTARNKEPLPRTSGFFFFFLHLYTRMHKFDC